MKSRFRLVLPLTVAAVSLGLAGQVAAAGITGKLAERAREQSQQQASEPRRESRPASQPSRPASQPSRPASQPSRPASQLQSRPAQRPADSRASQGASRSEQRTERTQRSPQGAQVERRDRNAGSAGRTSRPAAAASPNAVADQPRRPGSSATAAGNASGNANRDRGVAGSLIQRQYQDSDNRDRDRDRDRGNNDRDRDNNGRDWDRDRDDRRDGWRDRDRRRTVHVIHHLPSGYRDYSWNGSRYYYHGGHWYRPYGSSYMTVTVPIGFFVGTLPGSYTSVWMGGTRYYYSDYQYYVYEPARRGYVVVQSPYGEEEEDAWLEDDLYVYPAQGQSEQQQADDRYECHRWAVDETGYDPVDDEYDAALREDYLRALTACLTGRGYTVR